MRILHTADWHVGKTIARRQRLDEAAAALCQVVEIAVDEKVDAVLVCGDVYEHLAPSAEAEAIVYDTLLALEDKKIAVVVIPGNHDAPRRWSAIAPLLNRFAVHVVPEVRRPDRGGVVEIASRDGRTSAQVAALPWVMPHRMFSHVEMMGLAEAPNQAFADEMARLIGALTRGLDPRKCTLFAGHLFVGGAAIGGGERSLTIGEAFAVTAQALPQVQYVALGHVHRPQRVPGSAVPARYSGSLLQLDFGEVGQDKSVAIVTVEPGKPVEVREVPITAGRRLVDVTGTLDELARHIDSKDAAYLRVTVKCDGPTPGLADSVRERLPHALDIRAEYPRADGDRSRSVRGMPPREQFARYYADRHGVAVDDAMLDLFDELLAEESER
jgi:exonuclease SbcD